MSTQTAASTATHFIQAFGEATGEYTMPLQQMLLLLALNTYGQISQQELPKHTGVARSSNSRNIAKLGAGETPSVKAGLGWVESFEDPKDRRTKMVRLTPKGKALMRSIVEKVG